MTPTDGHDCGWKEEAQARAKRILELEGQNEVLKRALFGKKSEKLPRPAEALKKRGDIAKIDPETLRLKRAENQKWKGELPVETVVHPLPPNPTACALCGGLPDHAMPPEVSSEYEKLQLKLLRLEHQRQKARCDCGSHIVVAPAPLKVIDKAQYGPGLTAWIVVQHCLDSLPFYRLAKSLERQGVPISDATLGMLFHRAAELLAPLYERMVELIRQEEVVQADETKIEVQQKKKTRRAWMWIFLAQKVLVYVFSPSRSGQTPVKILGASQGTLVVDAYTGYNEVTTPDKRERAGCLAHGRRKLFEVREKNPEVQEALDLILDVYLVEHIARANDIARSPTHRELRQTFSANAMARLKVWLDKPRPHWLPREPAGKAVSYMLDNWAAMNVFLQRVDVPVDNNASESALRLVAKFRDSSLFVGTDEAGKSLAVLMTLACTARAHGLNPETYLADALIRVQTTPVARIDELLPQNWKPVAA